MNKRTNILLSLSMFISVMLIFFNGKLGNLYIIQAVSCGLAIMTCNISKLKIKKDSLIWILAGIVSMLSIAISKQKETTIPYVLTILMLIMIKIIYENHDKWQKKFITLMTIASGINVFATIIQLIFPNIIANINKVLLTAEGFAQNQMFFSAGAYAGINIQTAANAYFIAIFIGITFVRIVLKPKQKVNIILLMIAIIALFITAKRGILIFTLVSMIFVYIFLLNKNKKDIFKYLIILMLIGTIGYIAVINIPETQIIFDKFTRLEEANDVLNGRDYLWKQSLNVFSENKVFGAGIGYVNFLLGDAPHNIYIQLLSETGIIGFITYIMAIISSLLISLKKASVVLKQKDESNKIYCSFSIFMQLLFITYGFTGNPLFSNIFFTPYIIAIAMINGISTEGSEKKNESRNNYIS